jgi:hypothetical protein
LTKGQGDNPQKEKGDAQPALSDYGKA